VQVNGRTRQLAGVGGQVTLLDWLRTAGLTGCKEGCAEGECGACAVLVARPDGPDRARWTAVNACLLPAAALDGQEVLTAEGLGQPGDLHPVQEEMAVRGGSQCGYCTPGFICSMAAEYYRPDRGEDGFDLHALSGNLCRCTGYRPIRDAAYALGAPDPYDPLAGRLTHPAPDAVATRTNGSAGAFVRPADLAEALDLLAEHPEAPLVAGSTDWGVDLNLRHARAPLTIGIDRLPELRRLEVTADRVEIGAALSLSEVERGLAGAVPLLDQLFPQFASRLIRNGATLGGNLATASPIGDAAPALLALHASVWLASREGRREVPLEEYFTGYRRSVRRPGELIESVLVPLPLAPLTGFHKIAKRRYDDISSVAVAFALRLGPGSNGEGPTVAGVTIGLGGVAATPLRALEAETALLGRPWTAAGVAEAADILGRTGTPLDDHRASAAYRSAMLRTSLLSFQAAHPGPEGER
jgi:xanthine dehydrogenase small subunit